MVLDQVSTQAISTIPNLKVNPNFNQTYNSIVKFCCFLVLRFKLHGIIKITGAYFTHTQKLDIPKFNWKFIHRSSNSCSKLCNKFAIFKFRRKSYYQHCWKQVSKWQIKTITLIDFTRLISYKKFSAFPLMKSLETLSISFMAPLKKIGRGGLSGLTSLKVLLCAHNPHLTYMHPSALSTIVQDGNGTIWPPLKKVNKWKY